MTKLGIVYLVRIQFLMTSAARLSLCLPLAMSVKLVAQRRVFFDKRSGKAERIESNL